MLYLQILYSFIECLVSVSAAPTIVVLEQKLILEQKLNIIQCSSFLIGRQWLSMASTLAYYFLQKSFITLSIVWNQPPCQKPDHANQCTIPSEFTCQVGGAKPVQNFVLTSGAEDLEA